MHICKYAYMGMHIPKQQMKRTSIPSHLWSSVLDLVAKQQYGSPAMKLQKQILKRQKQDMSGNLV